MANTGDILRLELVFLSLSEGGRKHTPSLVGGWYRPHLVVPPHEDMMGVQFLGDNSQDVVAGESISTIAKLVYTGVSYSLLAPGAIFEVREGHRTVGRGRVIGIEQYAA